MLQDLLAKRLIFVTGKGGVGKTTIATLLGLINARQKKKTLILEYNSLGQIPKLFGAESEPHKEIALAPYLSTQNLSPSACFEEYVIRQIRFKTLYKTLFNNSFVQNFVKAVPGLNELLLLGKTMDLERKESEDSSGKPLYDCIIVDTPASGHAFSLFEVPYTVINAAKVGPLVHNAELVIKLIEDHNKSSFVFGTLLEEMPVNETFEFVQKIHRQTNCHISGFFLNQVLPKRKTIAAKKLKSLPDDLSFFGDLHRLASSRYKLQQEYKKIFKNHFPREPIWELPHLFEGVHSLQDLQHLETGLKR